MIRLILEFNKILLPGFAGLFLLFTGCNEVKNFIVQAHVDEVMSVSFSSDSRYLVTGSKDGTAKVFDSDNSWELLCELKGHSSWVYQAEFMPGDHEIITAGFEGDLKLWTFASCHESNTYKGHTDRVRAVSVHHSGDSFVSCGWDSTFISWNKQSGEILYSVHGHPEKICDLTLSFDGTVIATASRDHTVSLWDRATGKLLKVLDGHSGDLKGVRFSSDGRYIASTGFDSIVIVWDAVNWELKHRLEGHQGFLFAVAFDPTNDLLASAGNDGRIVIWDPETGKRRKILFPDTAIRKLSFSPNGRYLAAACADGSVRIYNTGKIL